MRLNQLNSPTEELAFGERPAAIRVPRPVHSVKLISAFLLFAALWLGPPAAQAQECRFELKVSGAVSFTDSKEKASVAITDRNGDSWMVLQANNMFGKPPYLLWLGFPKPSAAGKIPLYEEGMNRLNLKMVGGAEFGAFDSFKLKRDPGFITIEKLGEGWVEARIEGLLSDQESGSSIEIELEISTALPPARCP